MKIDDTDNTLESLPESLGTELPTPHAPDSPEVLTPRPPREENSSSESRLPSNSDSPSDEIPDDEAAVIDDTDSIPVSESSVTDSSDLDDFPDNELDETELDGINDDSPHEDTSNDEIPDGEPIEEDFGGELLTENPDSEDELIDELNADDEPTGESIPSSNPPHPFPPAVGQEVDHTNLVTVLEYNVSKTKPEDDEENPRTFVNVLEARSVLEGYLFSCNEPLSLQRLSRLMNNLHPRTLQGLLTELQLEYENRPGALQIVEIAGGYQMATRSNIAPWMFRLHKHRKRSNLSPATLETLAIVAYKQPVTKGDIEAIRGVESSAPLRTLQDLNLIESRARREVIGRPQLFNTTDQFLKTFGLKSLNDMPSIGELRTQYADEQKLNRAVSPTEPLRRAKPQEEAVAAAAMEEDNPLAGFMVEPDANASPETASASPTKESAKAKKKKESDNDDEPIDYETDELVDLDDIDDEIEDEEVDLELENDLYEEDDYDNEDESYEYDEEDSEISESGDEDGDDLDLQDSDEEETEEDDDDEMADGLDYDPEEEGEFDDDGSEAGEDDD